MCSTDYCGTYQSTQESAEQYQYSEFMFINHESDHCQKKKNWLCRLQSTRWYKSTRPPIACRCSGCVFVFGCSDISHYTLLGGINVDSQSATPDRS